MSWIKKKYNLFKNGIIFTLLFHIILFAVLNISQFRIKKEYKEVEIRIEIPIELTEPETIEDNKTEGNTTNSNNSQTTNRISNKANKNIEEFFNDDYQKELENAQKLAENVSQQLSKEIPTIDDLAMPEEKTDGMNPDSILNNLYNGESNIEYFLEERYHLRLPIPVYLSQYGGTVKVNIVVDQNGNVIKATPTNINNTNKLLLSYAKTAALRTKFNPINTSKEQNGYIKYNFIAQ